MIMVAAANDTPAVGVVLFSRSLRGGIISQGRLCAFLCFLRSGQVYTLRRANETMLPTTCALLVFLRSFSAKAAGLSLFFFNSMHARGTGDASLRYVQMGEVDFYVFVTRLMGTDRRAC